MYYEFYLDVYFLENLILHSLALHLAGLIQREKPSGLRILAASAAAAGFSSVLLLFPIHKNAFLLAIVHLLFCYLAACICTKKRGAKARAQFYLAVCASALILGGCWQFLSGALAWPFWAAAPAGYALARALLAYGRRVQRRMRFIYEVTLERGGRTAHVKALLDSGNQLVQPMTAKPVHIVDLQEIEKLLTDAETRELRQLLDLTPTGSPSGKFTCIPYHSIGGAEGVLPAMTLDLMCVKHGESAQSTREVLVAVSKKAVSSRGEYQMILHPQILE